LIFLGDVVDWEYMPIKILPQELINQIAAGEVIERPASVIKELVENSIDAQAKKIIVELVNGGLKLIKVIDNGKGMTKEDVALSIQQHATSKISDAGDLFNIASLGFRGEALASISSVSEFCLYSRQPENVSATKVTVKNAQSTLEEVGSPAGTTVEVANLFYNIPARKKYLKSAVTEYNHTVDLFLNYVLAFADINWVLIHNEREVYNFSATENLLERFEDVLGKEVCEYLLPVSFETSGIKIFGYLGKPQIARKNKKLQYLFVNERPVKEFVISKMVRDAFGQLIPRDLHPVYLLFLKIDPEKIDVNVHPRKLEVRFSDPQMIYREVYKAVGRVIDESDLVKKISFDEPVVGQSPFEAPKSLSSFKSQKMDFSQAREEQVAGKVPRLRPDDHRDCARDDIYKYHGQVDKAYLIISDEQGIKFVDQHAASERIQYEKISAEWKAGQVKSQQLMFPENLELPISEANLLKQGIEFLQKLGFEIEEFGENTFLIRAVPNLLSRDAAQELIKELLNVLENKNLAQETSDEYINLIDDILKIMSCRSAVKFGDELSEQEACALIEQLQVCQNQATCVHGRPCIIEFTFTELEKLFKRK